MGSLAARLDLPRLPSRFKSWGDVCPISSDYWPDAELEQAVLAMLERIEALLEAQSAGSVYASCSALTPAGNQHIVICNGAVKPEGEAAVAIKAASINIADQIEAFRKATVVTVQAIVASRPEGQYRCILRRAPNAARYLKDDGLYVDINLRLGWDAV